MKVNNFRESLTVMGQWYMRTATIIEVSGSKALNKGEACKYIMKRIQNIKDSGEITCRMDMESLFKKMVHILWVSFRTARKVEKLNSMIFNRRRPLLKYTITVNCLTAKWFKWLTRKNNNFQLWCWTNNDSTVWT